MFCRAVYWWAHLIGRDHHHGGTKEQAPIWLVEFIEIQKKSDFSPSKFQLVGDVIGCCRSLVRLSVIFTGIYVSVTFLSPFCYRFHPWVSPFHYSEPSHVKFFIWNTHYVNFYDANLYSAWFYWFYVNFAKLASGEIYCLIHSLIWKLKFGIFMIEHMIFSATLEMGKIFIFLSRTDYLLYEFSNAVVKPRKGLESSQYNPSYNWSNLFNF